MIDYEYYIMLGMIVFPFINVALMCLINMWADDDYFVSSVGHMTGVFCSSIIPLTGAIWMLVILCMLAVSSKTLNIFSYRPFFKE